MAMAVFPRPVRRAAAGPLLLLAAFAAVPAGPSGPAWAAAGPDVQYQGRDDRIHPVALGPGCFAAEGGGSRPVVNRTRSTVLLYRGPDCSGSPVAVVRPGASAPVAPMFDSMRFTA
ncbi:hypothetical protein [Streptomyces sp. NPDC012888]|uniref:hypothetical protein n=1 Tax=Streptomyces sp. NPDC012888 TaxID=3364855 RepID=UPI00369715E0